MATSVEKTKSMWIGEGEGTRLSKWTTLLLQNSIGFACNCALWKLEVHEAAQASIYQALKIFICNYFVSIEQH